jgi:hypothetical protein
MHSPQTTEGTGVDLFPEQQAYEIARLADQTFQPVLPHAINRLEAFAKMYQPEPAPERTVAGRGARIAGLIFAAYGLWEKDFAALSIGAGSYLMGSAAGKSAERQGKLQHSKSAHRAEALSNALTGLRSRVAEGVE